MTVKSQTRTFATKMPDKPGAFMLACKIIMENGGNIVRVSFNKGLNLFIEVSGTDEQLDSIDKGLGSISYVEDVPPEPNILVMSVRITDKPGSLYPVLKIIDKYDVNIDYLNSNSENKGYQDFNIGMTVDNPEISKKILDEVAEIYPLDVPDYRGHNRSLDNTVSYIRLANSIQRLFSLGDDKVMEFISESSKVSEILEKRHQDPKDVFESVKQLANYIAFHRDLNFIPKISQIEITPETTLHVIEPPCGSNTYVLRNNDDLLFIDTGLGIYSDEMITELREMFPCFFSMRKKILVTHADVDHCGLLSVIENAEIIMTKKTKELLGEVMISVSDDGVDANPFSVCYEHLSRIISDYTPPTGGNIKVIGKHSPDEKEGLELIDRIKFGDLDLEVYEGCGGHLRGETILFCREPKLLFTGDIYVNAKQLTPERADFDSVAPFLLTNVDADPKKLKIVRSKIGKIMDDAGRSGMIVCGGHGAIKVL